MIHLTCESIVFGMILKKWSEKLSVGLLIDIVHNHSSDALISSHVINL